MTKLVRAELMLNGAEVVVFCKILARDKIKAGNISLGLCDDLSIVLSDKAEFIVESMSIPEASLISYSIGYIKVESAPLPIPDATPNATPGQTVVYATPGDPSSAVVISDATPDATPGMPDAAGQGGIAGAGLSVSFSDEKIEEKKDEDLDKDVKSSAKGKTKNIAELADGVSTKKIAKKASKANIGKLIND